MWKGGGQGKESCRERREAIFIALLPPWLLFSPKKCGRCLHYVTGITTGNPTSLFPPTSIFLTSCRTRQCWPLFFMISLSFLKQHSALMPMVFLLTSLSNRPSSCLQHFFSPLVPLPPVSCILLGLTFPLSPLMISSTRTSWLLSAYGYQIVV